MKGFDKIVLKIKEKLNLIILFLAVITLICGAVFIIKNVGNTVVSLGKAQVNVSETVDIPLEINKNSGTYMAQIYIDYDADNLSFVSNTNGDVYDMCMVNDNKGKLSILLEMHDKKETTKNGVITTLKFKSKISSDEGSYNLKFNDECMFINYDMDTVKVKYQEGKITIKE